MDQHGPADPVRQALARSHEFWNEHVLTPLEMFLATVNLQSNVALLHVKLLIFVG